MTPAELNLREWISGTLTNQIVEFIKREDVRNGTNANYNAKKRRKTAQATIDQHKAMTAGLHFAVWNTSLGPTLMKVRDNREWVPLIWSTYSRLPPKSSAQDYE